jgi:hypothetical protein
MLFQAFLGGLSCKLYDDLNDNIVLKKFYNATFMEYLKGIHYVSFVSVSINDPLFFIFFYIGCFLNHIRDGDAFKEPYEHSLLYSFILLFIILDYTKIANDVESIESIDIILLSMLFFLMVMEKMVMRYFGKDVEFSTVKLKLRTLVFITCIMAYLFCKSKYLKHLFTYLIGYLLVSILIQYYSLLKTNNAKNDDVINNVNDAVDNVNDAVDNVNDAVDNVNNTLDDEKNQLCKENDGLDNQAKLASQNSKKKLRIKGKKMLKE